MHRRSIAETTETVSITTRQESTPAVVGFAAVSVVLGVAMVAETLLLLYIAWSRFGSATNDNALYTFSFQALLYFAVFSIVSARERRCFWATMPSKTLVAALTLNALAGTVLTIPGLPGLMPLPWWQTLTVFGDAMFSCLVVNDALKVAMIKWRVPMAVGSNEGRGASTRVMCLALGAGVPDVLRTKRSRMFVSCGKVPLNRFKTGVAALDRPAVACNDQRIGPPTPLALYRLHVPAFRQRAGSPSCR